MAADNTYTFSTSAKNGARPDLGLVAGPWMETAGLGPQSEYVALKALGRKMIAGSGAISAETATWYQDDDYANRSGERPVGGEFVYADPETLDSYNVNLVQLGKVVTADFGLDPNVIDLVRLYGSRAAAMPRIEEMLTRRSLNLLLQMIDVKTAAVINAASTPYSTADTSATSAKWSTASSSVRTQIHGLKLLFDGDLETVVLSRKSWEYLLANTDFTGATLFNQPGIGTITPAQGRALFMAFGVQNVHVGKTAIWTDYVDFMKGSGGNMDGGETFGPHGGIITYLPGEFADEWGISYNEWWSPDGQKYNIVAHMTLDVIAPTDNGARITDTY